MRAERLLDYVDSFVVSADRNTIVIRDGHRLRAISAEKSDNRDNRHEPSRKTGWIDLNRIRLSIERVEG